jgi:caa(3)-type oxidase subunit IV
MENKDRHSHHHIVPNKVAFGVGAGLMILTLLTVWIAGVDLGRLNFIAAMVIATIKALLVALFFMNLWYDHKENGAIFATAFLFLAIFIVLTSTDVFFRGDVYVHGPITSAQASKSKLNKPWISTPELIAHGKELFQVQCIACHGPEGKGDGPAAAALNPHPRNFTSAEGWVNGRKHTMVFKTLKEGVSGSGMASFATLPTDDRWALDAYVLSLGPQPVPEDTPADFAKAGVDPNGGVEKEAVTVPVEVAMKMMSQPPIEGQASGRGAGGSGAESQGPGAELYRVNCASCHGAHGEGGIKVRTLALAPSPAYVETTAFKASSEPVSSEAVFDKLVSNGIPGNLMPGFGQLSGAELRELHGFVHALAR